MLNRFKSWNLLSVILSVLMIDRSPSNPLICHFAGIVRKNGYPLWISVLSEMVEISGFEPLTS